MVVKLRNTSNFSPKKRKKRNTSNYFDSKIKNFFFEVSCKYIYIYIYEYDLPLVLF